VLKKWRKQYMKEMRGLEARFGAIAGSVFGFFWGRNPVKEEKE
jgi:hypothetical protein